MKVTCRNCVRCCCAYALTKGGGNVKTYYCAVDEHVVDPDIPRDCERFKRHHRDEEAPKCDLRWEDDHYVVECDTPEDRDRAAKALEEKDIVVKVRQGDRS